MYVFWVPCDTVVSTGLEVAPALAFALTGLEIQATALSFSGPLVFYVCLFIVNQTFFFFFFEVSFSSNILLFGWKRYLHKDDFPWADPWTLTPMCIYRRLG